MFRAAHGVGEQRRCEEGGGVVAEEEGACFEISDTCIER
jgi:hypothetical protein